MKTNSAGKYTTLQKVMIVIIPIVVLLLLASLATLAAMLITGNFGDFSFFSSGNIVIIMALCSAVIAIGGIIFTIATVGKEPDDEEEE